jgi:hypothetical protein
LGRDPGITGIGATMDAAIMGARDTATVTDEDLVTGAAGIANLTDADFVAMATGVSKAAVKAAFAAAQDRAAAVSTVRPDHKAVQVAFMAVGDRMAVATGNSSE